MFVEKDGVEFIVRREVGRFFRSRGREERELSIDF